jgi:hypothetical protein
MISEPECVALKRRGAEYVARLLKGKSQQERLEFWMRRAERPLSIQKQKQGNQSMKVQGSPLRRTDGHRQ